MKSGGYEYKGFVKHPVPDLAQGKVRDLIAKDAGVSGKTVDKFKYIEKHAPEKADLLCAGDKDDEGNIVADLPRSKVRDLNTAQKVELSMKKQSIFERQAEKRMKSGGYEYKGSVKHPSPDQGEGCLQDLNKKTSQCISEDAGVSPRTVEQYRYIKKNAPDLAEDLCMGKIVESKGKMRKLSIDGVYKDLIRENARAELTHRLESIEAKEAKAIQGVYEANKAGCFTMNLSEPLNQK